MGLALLCLDIQMNEKYANIIKIFINLSNLYFHWQINSHYTCHIAIAYLKLLIFRIKFKSYEVLSKFCDKN